MDTIPAIIRACVFGSGMGLLAVIAFRWLFLLPIIGGNKEQEWAVFNPLFHRLQHWTLSLLAVQLATSILWFWLVLTNISGEGLYGSLNLKMIQIGLTQTSFGMMTSIRLGGILLLGAMLWNLSSERWYSQQVRSPLEWGAGLLVLSLLFLLSFMGHAASSLTPGHFIHLFSDALHLVIGGLWPGMLLPFSLYLDHIRRTRWKVEMKLVGEVIHSFSNISLISVGLLILTGCVESYFTVGRLSALIETDYGRILLTKLILVGIMIGVGFRNRFHLKRQFLSQAHGDIAKVELIKALHRNILIEVCLTVAVLVVVGFLGMTPPPYHASFKPS